MTYSELKNGEFHFGFKEIMKTVRVGCLQAKNKIRKKKCKIEPLEVSGYWA